MTETLSELLRRGADAVAVPDLDLDGLVAEAGRRRRRRRLVVVATAAATVGAVTAVSVLGSRATVNTQQPPPVAPATPSGSTSHAVDPVGARPLVYAEGRTVHVGDKTIEAEDPVAFIGVTDDGAVYEASLDGTLWFTDGSTTAVIGTSGYTAAPTSHGGVVMTGDSGSLVVWADMSGGLNKEPDEFVVYDTSRRAEVARIPFPGSADIGGVIHVGEDQVWLTPDVWPPDCWFRSSHRCPDPRLLRFDVASGETTQVRMSEFDAELSSLPRMFVARGRAAELASPEPGFSDGTMFRQVGSRLVTVTDGGDRLNPLMLVRTSGEQVRLRLPDGYKAPGLAWGGSVISMAQWLDDDHVVVWANEGGGDLPPQHGDLLVCRVPDGVCHVEVPRSSRSYVAPY
jgi:cell wall-associated NlpC family hydrolase